MKDQSGARWFRGAALNVRDPARLAAFYRDALGMNATRDDGVWRVAYDDVSACVELRPSPSIAPYRHARTDRYWKIGITIPDLDKAHAQLTRRGIVVSPPQQFEDIGYLCHLTDPEGFQIELLQHTFLGEPLTRQGDDTLPLGGGARIAHITLRTNAIAAELARYRDDFGMTLLSVQPVPRYGFELYFLAFTDERPPDPDLEAVVNRPWLWQRPYPVLELQHWPGNDAPLIGPADIDGTGFAEPLID